MASSLSVERGAGPAPVASSRHTLRLAGLFVILGASGLLRHASGSTAAAPETHPRVALLYATLIGAQWLLFRAVTAGLKAKGIDWRTLLGRAGSGGGDLARDLLLGVLLCAGWVGALAAVRSSSAEPAAGPSLLPRGPLEIALWILLSLSAGFCEEMAFRGYFQRQFEALTGRRGVALAMQAILFGVAHAYQGLPSALAIAGYGVLFGALALWRRRLRPAMVAHALTDLVLGLFSR